MENTSGEYYYVYRNWQEFFKDRINNLFSIMTGGLSLNFHSNICSVAYSMMRKTLQTVATTILKNTKKN